MALSKTGVFDKRKTHTFFLLVSPCDRWPRAPPAPVFLPDRVLAGHGVRRATRRALRALLEKSPLLARHNAAEQRGVFALPAPRNLPVENLPDNGKSVGGRMGLRKSPTLP